MKRPRRQQTLPPTAPKCSFASNRRPPPPISPLSWTRTNSALLADPRRPAFPGARRVNQACEGGPDAHREDAGGQQGRWLHRNDRLTVMRRFGHERCCRRSGCPPSPRCSVDAAPHREFAMRRSSMNPRPILALLLCGVLLAAGSIGGSNSAAAFGMFGFGRGGFGRPAFSGGQLRRTPPPRLGGGRVVGRPPGGSGQRAGLGDGGPSRHHGIGGGIVGGGVVGGGCRWWWA